MEADHEKNHLFDQSHWVFIFLFSSLSLLFLLTHTVHSRWPPSVRLLYQPASVFIRASVRCNATAAACLYRKRSANALNAGIQVITATCGRTGMTYPSLCGYTDGKIYIFEVPTAQAQAALSLGFGLLSDLPNASRYACQSVVGSGLPWLLLLLGDAPSPPHPTCPVIPNGDFESGQTVWTEYSTFAQQFNTEFRISWLFTPHSGSWAVRH